MANVDAVALKAGGGRAPRRLAWAGLLVLVLAAVALVAVPVWVIHPFKPQTQAGLELSYALRRWSPAGTVALAVASAALAAWLWRGSRRWWRKALLVAALVPALAAVWFARQNYFEWVFRPLPNAAYAAAGDASFVADADMVLAVEINGDAVAYPVRQMAYHHLVQDVVGGTPVVSTY